MQRQEAKDQELQACVYESSHVSEKTEQGPVFVTVIARSSGPGPKSWKSGRDTFHQGIQSYAKSVFNVLQNDHEFPSGMRGTLLAKDNIHTSVFPTSQNVN